MDTRLLIGALLALSSCADPSSPAHDLPSGNQADVEAKASDKGGPAATMSLLNTTWEFDDTGEPTVITIDNEGTYIENRLDGMHVVHGTYTQQDGMDCFTSAMGDRRTSCWTAVPPTSVGETATATSENGGSAVFKRVSYRVLPLSR